MAGDSSSSVGPGEMTCPDPSVHEHHHRLSEQASTAALYVTQTDRHAEAPREARENPLGPDGKLSSKGAAASLKYARAQDLPSYPIAGLGSDSAGKAAMLAKDYKMKELWQPEASNAGSKAALIAAGKGSKVDIWQPEASAAGSKAALIAAGKGSKVDLWQPTPSANSNSAALLAMRNKTLSPKVELGTSSDGKSKALLAATMSHSRGRERATSTPAPAAPAYPDSRNAVANALNAATVSHRASVKPTDGWDSEANQAARVKNLGAHMERAMFSERPPVEPELEEAKYNAALRASAVSMAKQMYDYQAQKEANAAAAAAGLASGSAGAEAAARNVPSTTRPDIKEEAMRYIHLQDAAHKLAAERLAKVDKNMEAERYREYYGYSNEKKTNRLSQRLSVRGRNRASSEGTADLDDSSDDEEQARRIRSQMSQLHSGITTVDSRKQQDDRARLLAAAEKRVSMRMQDMDSRVYAETGKVSPAMMEEWEAKARKRAQEEREVQAANPGRTHIGGGKYMSQADIEAIAAARLRPTLDDINETAEKRRAHDEELRSAKEEQERQKREEKARQREEKEEQRRIKDEEKAIARQEKDQEKARKEEEKAMQRREKEEERLRKNEEKRIAKEDKRKSREVKREEEKDAAAAVAGSAALAEVADKVKEEHEEHEDHEEPTASDAVHKHRSALGRLRDRFRRDHEDGDVDTEHERSRTGNSDKAVVTAAAGGAATGVLADQLADEHRQAGESTPSDLQPTTLDSSVPEASPAGVLTTPAVHDEVSPIESGANIAPLSATTEPAAAPTAEELTAAAAMDPEEDQYEYRKEPDLPGNTETRDYTTAAGAAASSDVLKRDYAEDRQALEEQMSPNASAIGVASTADRAIPSAAAPVIIASAEEDVDDEDSNEDLPPADPSRPTFEQQPSLSGYYNDAFPTLATTQKPDLERHISQIPEQDDDDDDEDTASDDGDAITTATRRALLERRITRELSKEGPGGLREDIADPAYEPDQQGESIAPFPADEQQRGEIIEPVGVIVPTRSSAEAGAMLIEKNDPALGLLGLGATGHTGPRAYKSKERIDDLLYEPSEPQQQIPEPVLPLETTNAEAEKSLSTNPGAIGRTPVEPAEPVSTVVVGQQEARAARPSTEIHAGKTTTNNVDTPANDYIRKTSTDVGRQSSTKKKAGAIIAGVATGGLATVNTKSSRDESKEISGKSPEKERHGFRGLISRMTHRHSKSENKLQENHAVSYDAHKAAEKPTSSETTGYSAHRAEKPTTVAPIDAANASNTGKAAEPEPDSPSSFRRGEPDPTNADDVSSSGADEDDVGRGRGRGGFARKLGFGDKDHRHLLHKDPPPEVAAAQEQATAEKTAGHRHGSVGTDGDEQYEEARDQFDESLAPPPAFAGQRKSESPVRETKFQEEL